MGCLLLLNYLINCYVLKRLNESLATGTAWRNYFYDDCKKKERKNACQKNIVNSLFKKEYCAKMRFSVGVCPENKLIHLNDWIKQKWWFAVWIFDLLNGPLRHSFLFFIHSSAEHFCSDSHITNEITKTRQNNFQHLHNKFQKRYLTNKKYDWWHVKQAIIICFFPETNWWFM